MRINTLLRTAVVGFTGLALTTSSPKSIPTPMAMYTVRLTAGKESLERTMALPADLFAAKTGISPREFKDIAPKTARNLRALFKIEGAESKWPELTVKAADGSWAQLHYGMPLWPYKWFPQRMHQEYESSEMPPLTTGVISVPQAKTAHSIRYSPQALSAFNGDGSEANASDQLTALQLLNIADKMRMALEKDIQEREKRKKQQAPPEIPTVAGNP